LRSSHAVFAIKDAKNMIRSEHCKFLSGKFAKNKKSASRDSARASATGDL